MASADALTIFSGIIILFRNSGKSADFPELPFHGWGFGTNPLRHLALLDASSPEGGAFWVLPQDCTTAQSGLALSVITVR